MHSLKILFLFAAILLAAPQNLLAQSRSLPKTFSRDASHAAGATGNILTAPLRWQGSDWANFGMVIGGTFALSFLDEELNDYLQNHRSQTADKIADAGIAYGEPLTVAVLTGGVYAVGLFARSQKLRDTAVILTGSLLPTGLLQTVTKRAVGRARPHLGLGHDVFDPFRKEEGYYSFFSGHTMVAMATSHTFARQFPHPVTKIVFYSLGVAGGFARLYEEDHWLSDVVLGGALAIVSVNSTAKWLAQRENGQALGHVQWRVFAQRNGLGVEAAW